MGIRPGVIDLIHQVLPLHHTRGYHNGLRVDYAVTSTRIYQKWPEITNQLLGIKIFFLFFGIRNQILLKYRLHGD